MANKIAAGAHIADDVIIGSNVVIGDGCTINPGCIIGNNVVIEEGTYLDYGVIVRDYVSIKEGGKIGARCILGEYLVEFFQKKEYGFHPLVIGKNAQIRSETIIYGENELGDYFQTGHRVTIREKSSIGNHVRIGTLSDIQGYCEIQDYVNLHSNVHIGQKSVIQKYAWIFPYVVLTNDPNPPSESLLGVTIEEFAVVSTGSIILPGLTVGAGALVGAGAIVTKNIEQGMVAVGNPAKAVCHTERITDNVTGEKVYPWQYTFDRGMPWQDIGYEKWEKEQQRDENNAEQA